MEGLISQTWDEVLRRDRSNEQPQGDESKANVRLANILARRICYVCLTCIYWQWV